MTAASQSNTEVIVIDSDGDDENDLGLALKRAPRTVNLAADRLPNTQEQPTPRPPTINKTIRPTQRREDNNPPPEKIQIPIARLSQADRDLFRDFEQRHAVPRKVHFASTLSANTGPDHERVRKAAEYAPSKQEQRRAEYRNKARAKRAGDIHNNIVKNARKEYPNKNEAAIQREAQARVDAWRRDRAAEDKAERLLNLDGLKAQQRRAVTSLSSATTVDFLGKNRVVVVFTVFQSEPFDENDGLDDTDREYNLVRLDSFIDMKKANDLATKQIYGGLTVNKDQRKEVNLRDNVMPSINAAKDALSSDIQNIELAFNPELHDSGYDFLSSTV
ncbi:hypothetical protein UCRPA7_6444 [Phaeoacremonium minimum UCRPA7]|uniref:Uncharacterized protein n=1 Tax=Phaeoacremonium minimum (strain UCR-PA7) TaxID=1286976 RepID=R8BFI9_PHAM7|nr:hypothetical protein UCRPA7_6444 [Phaeoacremonium minimum UCRPA7]EON98070.1 hypothetical protein UCRPA7_6444 [Phaeoacremonium minimum UCRPA7]